VRIAGMTDPWQMLAIVGFGLWAWAELRGILARAEARGERTGLLDRIGAQTPGVLGELGNRELMQRELAREAARESNPRKPWQPSTDEEEPVEPEIVRLRERAAAGDGVYL